MLMEHSEGCFHCRLGCTHEHEAEELRFAGALAVEGSRMRRGGPFTDPLSGLTIGTDEWRRLRCPSCGVEAMTPLEMIMPMCMQDSDGTYLAWCPGCLSDIRAGNKPGHGAHRRRRRRS